MVKVRWQNGYVGECNEAVAAILVKKGRVGVLDKRAKTDESSEPQTPRRGRPRKQESEPQAEGAAE